MAVATHKPPTWFWIVGIAFLLWNLAGDAAYISHVTMDLNELANSDPQSARIIENAPSWVTFAYALAVWMPTIADVLLLLKRKLALPFYGVGLIGVIVQFGYDFLATDLLAIKGMAVAVFPLVIVAIALVPIWFCREATKYGWLA